MTENHGPEQEPRTWYEEFTVSGTQLLDQVKKLIAEGNVRRLYIKNQEGRTLLEIPLTAGLAVTAVTAALAPMLVAVGAIAAMLTQVTLGVERPVDSEKEDQGGGNEPPAPPALEP
ncbi:MAG TPA: DUF4342 domain-containing protein [Beutenbergiaceae bacterium]|nr:DUF4342 domain-containing protein [Beutenbergiaceae bacterium]